MQIRVAQLADAADISRLLAQTWRVAYRGIFPQPFLDNLQDDGWTEGFKKAVSDPTATTLVAEMNGEIVGMIGFGKARDPQFAPNEIYALNVLPAFQQQKIGSALMHAALAKLAGERVYLKVAIENHYAQEFYRKQGFHRTEIIQIRQIADFSFQEVVYCFVGKS